MPREGDTTRAEPLPVAHTRPQAPCNHRPPFSEPPPCCQAPTPHRTTTGTGRRTPLLPRLHCPPPPPQSARGARPAEATGAAAAAGFRRAVLESLSPNPLGPGARLQRSPQGRPAAWPSAAGQRPPRQKQPRPGLARCQERAAPSVSAPARRLRPGSRGPEGRGVGGERGGGPPPRAPARPSALPAPYLARWVPAGRRRGCRNGGGGGGGGGAGAQAGVQGGGDVRERGRRGRASRRARRLRPCSRLPFPSSSPSFLPSRLAHPSSSHLPFPPSLHLPPLLTPPPTPFPSLPAP